MDQAKGHHIGCVSLGTGGGLMELHAWEPCSLLKGLWPCDGLVLPKRILGPPWSPSAPQTSGHTHTDHSGVLWGYSAAQGPPLCPGFQLPAARPI